MKDIFEIELEDLLSMEDLDFDNDGEVQYAVGLCYKEGKGVEVDHDKAEEWFNKAKLNGIDIEDEANKTIFEDEVEDIDYNSLSIVELAKLVEKKDLKALIVYAEKDEQSFKELDRNLKSIDDNECEDIELIKRKYELLALKAQEENQKTIAREYFSAAFELGSKVADEYYVSLFSPNKFIEYENYIRSSDIEVLENDYRKIELIAKKGNIKAKYIIGRTNLETNSIKDIFESRQISIVTEKTKAIVYLDDVLNSDDASIELKQVAKGLLMIINHQTEGEFEKLLFNEFDKIEGNDIYLGDVVGMEFLKRYYLDYSGIEEKINERMEEIVSDVNVSIRNNESIKIDLNRESFFKFRNPDYNSGDERTIELINIARDYEKQKLKKDFNIYYNQKSNVDETNDNCLMNNISVVSDCFRMNNDIKTLNNNNNESISFKKFLKAPLILLPIMAGILAVFIAIFGLNDNYKNYYIAGGIVGLIIVIYSFFQSVYDYRITINEAGNKIIGTKMGYVAEYEKNLGRIILKSVKGEDVYSNKRVSAVVKRTLSVASFFARINFEIPVIVTYIILALSPIAFVIYKYNWGGTNGLYSAIDVISWLIASFVLAIVITIITSVISLLDIYKPFTIDEECCFIVARFFANIVGIILFWTLLLSLKMNEGYGVMMEAIAGIIVFLVGGVIALIIAICINLFIRLVKKIIEKC